MTNITSRRLKALVKRVLLRRSESNSILKTPRGISRREKTQMKAKVEHLSPWFHNMNLADGLWTNPVQPPGPDYPAWRWNVVSPLIGSVAGISCLDIGCSSGFFSLKLKELGARRVIGIDCGEQTRAIEQARFAAECLRAEVEFRHATVEDLAATAETFDLVLFLGVFYHLRHPLLALESIRRICSGKLIMQTITTEHARSSYEPCPTPSNYNSRLRSNDLGSPAFPSLRFIEGGLDGDRSCWFVPSPEAVLALLRASGFEPETMISPNEYELVVSALPI